jgi:hypothetical protein
MYAILNHKSQPDHLLNEQIARGNHDQAPQCTGASFPPLLI